MYIRHRKRNDVLADNLVEVQFEYVTDYDDPEQNEELIETYHYDVKDFIEQTKGKSEEELKKIFETEAEVICEEFGRLLRVYIYDTE